jgi:hypothetical protein
MEQPDAFLDAGKMHVHLVGGALKLEQRRFMPLVEQQVAGVEKAGHAHDDQECRDGQDQEQCEAPLQAGRLKDGHPRPHAAVKERSTLKLCKPFVRRHVFRRRLRIYNYIDIHSTVLHQPIKKETEAPNAMPLEGRHISYRYPNSAGEVFTDLNFRLNGPGFHALFGPSGVGKTTLAKLLSGTIRGFEGAIAENGIRRVLYTYNLERLPGWSNVRAHFDEIAPPAGRRRMEELIETFGMAANVDSRFHRLSLGQQNRANLILFEILSQSGNAMRELDQLARHHPVQAMDACNAVADAHHVAGLGYLNDVLVVLYLFPQNACNLIRPNLSHGLFRTFRFLVRNPCRTGGTQASAVSLFRRVSICPSTDPS